MDILRFGQGETEEIGEPEWTERQSLKISALSNGRDQRRMPKKREFQGKLEGKTFSR